MTLNIKNIFSQKLKEHFDNRTIEQWLRIYEEDKEWGRGGSDSEKEEEFNSDLNRLISGEPIQYVVGKAYFYDRLFNVNKDVLIPRPETEELVSLVLKNHRMDAQLSVLDVGTGTGCIGVVLKDHLDEANVFAIEKSVKAIKVAQSNADKYNLEITFLHFDFLNEKTWDSLPVIDVIVSNPPYIRSEEKQMMTDSVLNYEPMSALIPEHSDALIFYRKLAEAGLKLFNGLGKIYVEINEFLGPETKEIFIKAGYQAMMHQDMQGKDRMIIASIDRSE